MGMDVLGVCIIDIDHMLQRLAKGLLMRPQYYFSAGYFSHRRTESNNDSTPFDFSA
jgi:hypothetical protein